MSHPPVPERAKAVSPSRLRLVCLVSHTHWDREWYHGLSTFAQRLVALVDAVLALPGETLEDCPFLLDGQAIVLRDYVERRPSERVLLAAALQAGRLEAGPWYVLADNLIPSAEAIVRNLEAGRRVLAEFGATAPRVAYCPDSFGHPAAMPVLAQGFGLDVAVVWRGAGGSGMPASDTFWWRAASGERLLTYHLPPDGYEIGSSLPDKAAAAQKRWQKLLGGWLERNHTGLVLLLNGADHHARQPDLPAALSALEEAAGVPLRAMSLSQWREHLLSACREPQVEAALAAFEHNGELRNSAGYTWSLGGTLGIRSKLKRRNARLERGLLRDLEPWLALSRVARRSAGNHTLSNGSIGPLQFPDLISHLWETLLGTHPHDTLCGCSIDSVARRMAVAQEAVAEGARSLRRAAMDDLTGYDPVAARDHSAAFDWGRVVIRNKAARPRRGVAQVKLVEVLGDVPVGPGSAGVNPLRVPETFKALEAQGWITQPLGNCTRYWRRESPQHYPDNDLVRVQDTLIWLPEIPAMSVVGHNIRMALPTVNSMKASSASGEPDAHISDTTTGAVTEACISCDHNGTAVMSNGLLRVKIKAAGDSVLVELSPDSRTHVSAHTELRSSSSELRFESQRDAGDCYTPSLEGPAERLELVSIEIEPEHKGPLRVGVVLRWKSRDGSLRLRTLLTLDAGAIALHCITNGHNNRSDHRLQMVWQTDVDADTVVADAAFGPVQRPAQRAVLRRNERAMEWPLTTAPMHRWVMQTVGNKSCVLFSDGLAEYEAGSRRLALTLFRAVGELSKNDLVERPGHAGWPASVPGAQSRGHFAARCALLAAGAEPDRMLSIVRDVADDFLLPLVGESWPDFEACDAPPMPADSEPALPGGRPQQRWSHIVKGFRLHGELLEQSAVTLSARDRNAVLLRAINLAGHETEGFWELPGEGFWEVTRCRLDETTLGPIVVRGNTVPLNCGPREVITLRVKPARGL